MKKSLVIFLIVLFVSGFFLFLNLASAENGSTDDVTAEQPITPPPEEEEECISVVTCSLYCTGGCDGELWENCCDSCDGCWDTLIEDCSPWQMCSTGGCSCEGECLKTPENDRYYDNPTYSDQPDKNKGKNNIFLPVKLDWKDVEGWGQPDGPQSYLARITTSTIPFLKVLDKSEYIPRACLLPSNKTSYWGVKACCGADGTNCGGESNWSLTTNLAPEPVSPYDPDWTGEKGGENISLPVTLDWCGVEEANSLLLKVYILQGGQKICHPTLLATKNGQEFCDSWIIRKTRRDTNQLDRIIYSDLLDEDLSLFTGDTTYLWEIATCLDDSGSNCKDYSQQWTFTPSKKALSKTFLVSPPNDPEGQKPVGLPLILDWRRDAGINSWWYKINSTEKLTINSQSRSFDYPELSLNTSYQWQVLSCLDYEGKNCQDPWSETYYFKTTGQAPNLTYPASGEQNVTIPVDFKWEDVPGAKSYVFKVSGDGLNLEKILDKPELSLDFPDYPIHQETNYSWQVKTCPWEKGGGCDTAKYSSPQTFKTFRLPPPQNPSPANNGQFFTGDKYVSWGKVLGAKAYQYEIRLISKAAGEQTQDCSVPPQKTTLANSDYAELGCLGQYQWQVRSCLDESCQEASNWSSPWSFTLLEGGTGQNGLVPCGRATDDTKTPWNEREPCQIKHLFLSVKILVDFLLLRVMPIILVLLTIITAVMFYTSLGQVITMAKVISLWKAAGIGLLIIFFAWTIVNIFLKLIGYDIGVFGNWYQLPL